MNVFGEPAAPPLARRAAGRRAALAALAAYAPEAAAGDTVVLVEGASDRAALEVLAARAGRRPADERIFVVPMKGASNIGHFAAALGPAGLGLRLTGLCDAAEEPEFRQGLERAGIAVGPGPEGFAAAGFFICHQDLEDELIRALGADRTLLVVAKQGELASFRILVRQPFHRDRAPEQQLHRFFGCRSGRKLRYARLLAEALDDDRIPEPLVRLLAVV
jgi:hypothetical protein